MRRSIVVIMIIVLLVLFTGCVARMNAIPVGKTYDDWSDADKYCTDRSGLVTGFWGQTLPGLIMNLNGRFKGYEDCLRETGWLK